VRITSADLLNSKVPGKITLAGVRENIDCSLAYMSAWMGGNGCIPLNYLMEDAATAEITRVQLWQWVRYGARLDTGQPITSTFIGELIDQLVPNVKKIAPGVKDEHIKVAANYLKGQVTKVWPSEFLTSDLMPYLSAADGVENIWLRSAL
jgi:malate synthase